MKSTNKIAFFFLALLVLLGFANGLGNDFVADDRGLMINIPSYTFEYMISSPFFFFRSFPYFVLYQLFGFNSFVFRLPNILFHIGSVWLIFMLVSSFKNRIVGIFASCLFAIHPILVESVTWISGGVYTQYSFFFLLSFWTYSISLHSKKLYAFSLFSFILSLLSSEKAVVLCLVPLIYEVCFGNLKKNWKKVSVYFILSAFYLFLSLALGRLGARISGLQADQSFDQTFYNPLIQIPVAITSYLQLIFWPDMLTLYHSEMVFSQIEYIIRFLVFFLFLVSLVISYKKNKHIFFGLSFFLVTLLPTLTPLGISWVVAERYVYLGSLGIFVIVALAFQKLAENKQKRVAVYTVFSVFIIIFIIRTITRNIDWKNEDNLWLSAARTSPSSSQNHNNLGDYYGRHGDAANAAREFQKAISLRPNYADAYHNLGNAYRDMGKTKEALESYEKALSINPKLWQSYQNIAGIYYIQNKYNKVLEYLQIGLAANPKNIDLLAAKGIVYAKAGDKQKAQDAFLKILAIDPNNQFAKQALLELQSNTLQLR